MEKVKEVKVKKSCAQPKQKGAQERAHKILCANTKQQDVQVTIQYQK